jgi:hypothetical protein
MTFNFDVQDEHTSDLIAWMAATSATHGDRYAEAKTDLARGLGFEDGFIHGNIQFSAVNNHKQNMEKAEGKAVSIVPDASIVASGVVHLMELQEQGWSYVRP